MAFVLFVHRPSRRNSPLLWRVAEAVSCIVLSLIWRLVEAFSCIVTGSAAVCVRRQSRHVLASAAAAADPQQLLLQQQGPRSTMAAFVEQFETDVQKLARTRHDPARCQELAKELCNRHLQAGRPRCSAKQEVPLLVGLCLATQTVLRDVLPTKWTEPGNLTALDTCSLLLHSTTCVLHAINSRCPAGDTPFSVPSATKFDRHAMHGIYRSGIFSSVAAACSRASQILQQHDLQILQQDSTAASYRSFNQFIAALLALWNGFTRLLPTSMHKLVEKDMLSELLLPGAQLAGPALRLYAGPGAAAAAGAAESDRALPGYNFLPVLSSLKAAAASNMPARAGLGTSSLSARSTAQSSQQEQSITVSSQVGQELVSTIVAACLRVSETVSWSCYYFYMLQSKGTGVPAPATSFAHKVMHDPATMSLIVAQLFAQAKVMHDAQQGRAAVLTPRTSRSGRPLQRPAKNPEAAAAQVPAHHDALAAALGIDTLTDSSLFKQLTGVGASRHVLGSLSAKEARGKLLVPVCGLIPVLLQQFVFRSTARANRWWGAMQDGRHLAGAMTDRIAGAVLLVCVELCLLGDEQHQESALRLMSMVLDCMLMANDPAGSSNNSLCRLSPALQQIVVRPALQGVISLVVPALLPICHNNPLPSQLDTYVGTVSALLPQQIFKLVVAVDQGFLRELLEQYPLPTTRALEAALRTDAAERFVESTLRNALLHVVPEVLGSLGLAVGSQTTSASGSTRMVAASTNSTVPEVSRLAAAACSNKQLLAQVHALLATVAKYAAAQNAVALAQASETGSAAANTSLFVRSFDTLMRRVQSLGDHDSTVQQVMADMANTQARQQAYSTGQFRETLNMIASTAAAACSLGKAAVLHASTAAAAISAEGTEGNGVAVGISSGSTAAAAEQAAAEVAAAAAAPFVSLIGRCLYMVGWVLVPAAEFGFEATAGALSKTEYEQVPQVLRVLMDCLHWLYTEPVCTRLLHSAAAGTAAGGGTISGSVAAAELHSEMQQQVEVPAGPVAVITRGTATQLQQFGAGLCSLTGGVCGNPGCKELSGMSELAVVAPGSGRKGCGKCSACGSCTYCCRECQKKHWPAHKAFCKAKQKTAVSSTVAPASASS